jgi:superfamily II DNA or RNA helicase
MYKYKLDERINLFVKEHISEEDANRQMRTANEILKKLETYPGQILADEVGMGKTFVALAVAISVNLQDAKKRPVVVMIPSNLASKWPRDFERFKDFCVPDDIKHQLKCGVATNGVQFLKYLDDPIVRRKQVNFLTHGSLTRSLTDGWVKLAIIQRALHYRPNMGNIKRALKGICGELLYMGWAEKKDDAIWEKLLGRSPEEWLGILQNSGIDPEKNHETLNNDDPVPKAVIDAMYHKMKTSDFDDVLEALQQIPIRRTNQFEQRLRNVRGLLNSKAKAVWEVCSKNISYQLPLLILDEAHHLKNARTRLASLFSSEDAQEDANETQSGKLAEVFERMLFLTATPFQLGHHELCEVLNRFKGVKWKGVTVAEGGLELYTAGLNQLQKSLDNSQLHSTRLDQVWGQLTEVDKFVDGEYFTDENLWWESINKSINPTVGQLNAIKAVNNCAVVMKEAESELRKYVIRHVKSTQFIHEDKQIDRRLRWNGDQITLENEDEVLDYNKGLSIDGPALLPFLLAARHSIREKDKRPVFAEGIASSYETFLKTRNANLSELVDEDDEGIEEMKDDSDWYIQNLFKYVSRDQKDKHNHPKIKATVQKVMNLWEKGEKVLVFCHYIQTGKALRGYLSREMQNRIIQIGQRKLKCPKDEVLAQLEKIGDRFYNDGSLRDLYNSRIYSILDEYPEIEPHQRTTINEAVYKYLRTPSFLVRYFPIDQDRFTSETMEKALRTKGTTGESLEGMIKRFIHFQARKCTDLDRKEYLKALDSVQSGYIMGEDLDFEGGEAEKIKLVPNVRLVNGSTKQEARQTLMLTFNTPFFPEVMIASSVMAEGVDLHLNCRHIIHHDLCWNPSTLEQRTGRVDRIGSKGESLGKPVNIYLPFIAETQDEKMYRVVMDRERWFKVVMGEKFKADVSTADIIADRIPLPEVVVNSLTFDLAVKE